MFLHGKPVFVRPVQGMAFLFLVSSMIVCNLTISLCLFSTSTWVFCSKTLLEEVFISSIGCPLNGSSLGNGPCNGDFLDVVSLHRDSLVVGVLNRRSLDIGLLTGGSPGTGSLHRASL